MNRKKILIADDDPRLLTLLKATFGEEWDLVMAKDGEETLRIAEQEKPALIILDIIMPKIDGFAVCELLKSNPKTRRIPIIMLTAKTTREDILRGFEVGADEYFTKPFSPKALLDKIFELLI